VFSNGVHKVTVQGHDGVSFDFVSLPSSSLGRHILVSSQAGCAFGCSFCGTGSRGLVRHLTADEITDQVLYFHLLGQNITGVSFEGMGEPLANPKLFDAISALIHPDIFGLSSRRISVSTVGILPGLRRLSLDHPQVKIHLSLASPFPNERNILQPINQMYPLPEVLQLLDEHVSRSRRPVSISYVLIKGKNDSLSHSKGIADIIRSRKPSTRHLYNVRLSMHNPVSLVGGNFVQPSEDTALLFAKALSDAGIICSFIKPQGRDIFAASGQLTGLSGVGTDVDSDESQNQNAVCRLRMTSSLLSSARSKVR